MPVVSSQMLCLFQATAPLSVAWDVVLQHAYPLPTWLRQVKDLAAFC